MLTTNDGLDTASLLCCVIVAFDIVTWRAFASRRVKQKQSIAAESSGIRTSTRVNIYIYTYIYMASTLI